LGEGLSTVISMKLTKLSILAGPFVVGILGAALLRGEGVVDPRSGVTQVTKPWIQMKAQELAKSAVTRGSARQVATAKLSEGGARPTGAEVSRLTAELLDETGKVLREELGEVVRRIQRLRKKQEGTREDLKNRREADLKGSDETIVLQQLMERKSQLEQMISNVMKEASEEQSNTAQAPKGS
jgi:hypothetical protein